MFIPQPLRPFILCLGAALLLAACVAVVLSAATPGDKAAQHTAVTSHPGSAGSPPNPRPPLTPPSPTRSEDAAVRAILEIRREQGGLLDGTLLDELSRAGTGDPTDTAAGSRWQDEEFARALRGVATSASQAGEPLLSDPAVPAAPGSLGTTAIPDLPPLCGTGLPNSAVDNAELDNAELDGGELVDALRSAARRLDQQANHLEDTQRYADADRLRALSRRIRRESRRWVPPTWSSREQPPGVTQAPPLAPAP